MGSKYPTGFNYAANILQNPIKDPSTLISFNNFNSLTSKTEYVLRECRPGNLILISALELDAILKLMALVKRSVHINR